MLLEEIITPDRVLCNAQARSKKHCLEILSELLVRPTPEFPSEDVFEGLIERERLGCTSLDQGVAFPHCRIDGLDETVAALIKLSEPVDFDSPDGEDVDLVFGLMVPTELNESHRDNINSIVELLDDRELRDKMRDATTSSELYDSLIGASVATVIMNLRSARGS
ncbi:MAG: PTS sugar transporter subunit IIA [Gammaproteobacteria bacterium]|nr:PTS sugar transporter subunit IIA [Gammaproteobacteria bacterium]